MKILSKYVFVPFATHWLSMSELLEFDIALCNHNDRPKFLFCVNDIMMTGKLDFRFKFMFFFFRIRLEKFRGKQQIDLSEGEISKYDNLRSLNFAQENSIGTAFEFLEINRDRTFHMERLLKEFSETKYFSIKRNFEPMVLCKDSRNMRITDNTIKWLIHFSHVTLCAINVSCCFNITDDLIEHLTDKCPNLVEVSMNKCPKITDTSINLIAQSYPNINEVHCGHCVNLSEAALLHLIGACGKLTSLALPGVIVTGAVLTAIETHCGDSLVDFNLHDSRLPSESLSAVFRACKNLKYIAVVRCEHFDTPCLATLTECCCKIEQFSYIVTNGANACDLSLLAERMPSLTSLELHLDFLIATYVNWVVAILRNCRLLTKKLILRSNQDTSMYRPHFLPKSVSETLITNIAQHRSGIQTLSLESCKLSERMITKLATRCRDLKRFYSKTTSTLASNKVKEVFVACGLNDVIVRRISFEILM